MQPDRRIPRRPRRRTLAAAQRRSPRCRSCPAEPRRPSDPRRGPGDRRCARGATRPGVTYPTGPGRAPWRARNWRALGLRDDGRPAQRRQVVARQHDLRGEDQHRVGQAADDAAPRPRRAHPPRRPTRLRRHARSAQAGDGARPQGQRHGDRERRRVDASVDVVCLVLDATAPFGDGDRWVAATSTCRKRRRGQQVDVAGRERVPPSSPRPPSSTPRPTSRSRLAPATACRSSSSTSSLACRRGRRTSRPTPSATCPTSSGWPSWCASSCSPSPATSCRTRSPPGSSEWEGDRITVEIIVERESQKGMVIGRGGLVLKQVGRTRPPPAPRGHPPDAARPGRQGLAAPPRSRQPSVLTALFQAPTSRVGVSSTGRRGRGRRGLRLGGVATATRSPGVTRPRRARSAGRRRAARASVRRRA